MSPVSTAIIVIVPSIFMPISNSRITLCSIFTLYRILIEMPHTRYQTKFGKKSECSQPCPGIGAGWQALRGLPPQTLLSLPLDTGSSVRKVSSHLFYIHSHALKVLWLVLKRK